MDDQDARLLRRQRAKGPFGLRTGVVHEQRGLANRGQSHGGDPKSAVFFAEVFRETRGLPFDVVLEVIAKGDAPTDDEHRVRFGKGQRSGLKVLLRALEVASR